MSSSKPGWPPLTASRGSENGRRTLHDRVLDLHHDTSVYLNHLKVHNQGIPKPLVELITNTHAVIEEVLKNPLGDDWRKAVAELREITLDIKKNTTTTQHVLTTQSTVSWPSKVRSYAAAAAGAPPPGHTASSHGPSSSPGATPSELSKDREVIVKLPDAGAVSTFRRLKAVEIKNRAEKARVKASKEAMAATLASIKFVAARQLKSGDLSISLQTAQQAEIARCHPGWAKSFHQGAIVRLPTWGVVVHDVQVKSIGDLTDPKEAKRVADQLLAENRFSWGEAKIVHLTSHETRDCPLRQAAASQEPRKCANCGDAHAAWSKGCKKYAEEVDKVQAASCYRQRYHRIPPYLQDFRRDSESSGSDSTAVPSASPPASTPIDALEEGSPMQIEESEGSTTAKKATRPSKGSKKARSEPSRKQPPRGQAPASTSSLTSLSDQNVDDISFAPSAPPPKALSSSLRKASTNRTNRTSSTTASHRSARIVDRLNTINPPNLASEDNDHPPKQPRNKRTANARGTRLNIYRLID
ncbi:hypothetical protein CNMCM5623_007003 [Aspergillus felis]|uniref:Uncharacterized protein n=1 Tax=Aspergillus felis TaxID=1287682 RepID=A0A8H6QKH2_9EURO|nr:hypothetical protein CNMCM5623_007003 [Aspergillus felis]